MVTYGTLFIETRNAIGKSEDPGTAAMMARVLISQAAEMSQAEFLSQGRREVPEKVIFRVKDGVDRILSGEPFAYVLGNWEFYGLPLVVSPDVLIPRDDTCAVTALAIKQALFLEQQPRILDLCCGSGCIGLAIASKVKDARVTLADVSKEALAIAKKNIILNHMGGRVSSIQADALAEPAAFLGKFDMIVSNPPYITAQEMQELPESVKDYEPSLALFGGTDGLDFYRSICKNFSKALQPGGYLAFEFGMGQGDDVCRILEENNFRILERVKDYNDRERAVLAQHGGKE